MSTSTTTYSPGAAPLGAGSGSTGANATSTGSSSAGTATIGSAAPADPLDAAPATATAATAAATARTGSATPATASIPAPATKIDVDDSSLSAAERMEASRERLRQAMQQIAHPPRKPAPSGTTGKALHAAQAAAARVQSMPGASLLTATLERWWARHPLHDATVMAGTALVPYARRYPAQLVLASVALGAALVILRPWRLLLRRRVLFTLLPHFVATAVKQLPLASLAMMAGRAGAPASARRTVKPAVTGITPPPTATTPTTPPPAL